MPPPRVIFVNRVYWPSMAATAQLLTDLAEGLAARGWPVDVIASGHEPEPRNGVRLHRTGEGDQHAGMLSRTRNYWRFVRRARHRLAEMLRPGDLVVAMTDPPMLGPGVSGVARRAGAHVIHWIQDIYPEIVTAHLGALAGWPLAPLRLRRNAAWRSAARCVVVGDGMAQTVARAGVPLERIIRVPNWAPRELQTPASPADVAARRAAWGLTGKFVVAYSGNLGRVHEFAAVLAAAEILQAQAEIVFLFIGAGARYNEVRSAAQARRLSNLRFLPPEPRAALAASLAAADVQLVTLRPDFARLVYPSKLAGVLAAGRPVLFVGPPDGEIAALLAREQCGLTVAPAEGARLAAIIRDWQVAPDRRASLATNARGAYEKLFTYDSALNRWETVLRAAAPGN